MKTITLSEPTPYDDGSVCTSYVVGVSNKLNRVVRYSFTAPSTGATSVNLSFKSMVYGAGTQPKTFYFYIGTDADSHVNAGATSTYTGILNIDTSNYTAFSGSANIILLPNTTYYLFVFPATTTFGWYNWEGTAEMTVDGGVGLVYIDNGTSLDAYRILIDNGTSWDAYMPYIYDGTNWGLFS